jgi:predicted nucleotidyltransferase
MLKNSSGKNNKEDDSVLNRIVQRLVEKLRPDLIYLFGSRGRGDSDQDSDFDLLVVVPSSTLPRYKRNIEAFEALEGIGASKDVIVLTRSEFEKQKSVICSLPATVVREGRLIHARS